MATSTPIEKITAADFIPPNPTLETLREASKGCRGCPLYLKGTQTVFGEGPAGARMMLVGEQPGNDEDLEGRPFVGPAGRVLNQALESAGLSREETYVTNVVKHFKWEPEGKRRIHKKPNTLEIVSCRPWLEWEIELVEPEVLVCLGATAAQALFGRDFRLTAHHGEVLTLDSVPKAIATIHPSSVLRRPSSEGRHAAMAQLSSDLRVVASLLGK
jgi:DNA polymerase